MSAHSSVHPARAGARHSQPAVPALIMCGRVMLSHAPWRACRRCRGENGRGEGGGPGGAAVRRPGAWFHTHARDGQPTCAARREGRGRARAALRIAMASARGEAAG